MKCFVYELFCVNPKVPDRYLGYTTNLDQCMEYHEERSEDPEQIMKSTLYFAIHNTGGWSRWNSRILETVGSRKKALQIKFETLQENLELYSLNTHVKSLKPAYRILRDGRQVIL